jgi:hypothetical protein
MAMRFYAGSVSLELLLRSVPSPTREVEPGIALAPEVVGGPGGLLTRQGGTALMVAVEGAVR